MACSAAGDKLQGDRLDLLRTSIMGGLADWATWIVALDAATVLRQKRGEKGG